jgi:hypothetical protein
VQQPASAPQVTSAKQWPVMSAQPKPVMSAPRVTSAPTTVELLTAEPDPAQELELLAQTPQTRGKPAQ